MVRFVDVESPYSAPTLEGLTRNIRYARACVRDALLRGEMPYASHLFFTQPGILGDNVPEERDRGIHAGKSIIRALNAVTVVYTDLGMTGGMQLGVDMAKEDGREVVYRKLGEGWEERFSRYEEGYAPNGIWSPRDFPAL